MHKITSLVLAASMVAAPMSQAVAAPLRQMPEITKSYPGESYAQYRGHRYYRRDRRGNGAAAAAGIVGLAAGALIAGAIASQAQAASPPPPGTQDPQLAAYCARKYRSYDPATGTFLASNGLRYVCTY